MLIWLKHLWIRWLNFFIKWPSRAALETSARQIEKEIAKESPRDDTRKQSDAPAAPQYYCCVLFWDETTGRSDEAITVSSEEACRRLAAKHDANYRTPILNRRCS